MTKKSGRPIRDRRVLINFSQEEYEKFQARLKASTCRTMTQLVREMSLGRPITVRYRNQSAEDFLPIAIGLRDELTAIKKKFDEAIMQQRLLDGAMEHTKRIDSLELHLFYIWQKIDEITLQMHKIYQAWSQK